MMRFRLVAMLALLTLGEGLPAQSPVTGSAADGVVLEQPRIDDWEGFRTLSGRIPFELLPSVGQSAVSGTAG